MNGMTQARLEALGHTWAMFLSLPLAVRVLVFVALGAGVVWLVRFNVRHARIEDAKRAERARREARDG